MMTAALSRRAQALSADGEALVTATVVHVQRPASVEPGNVALVLPDGTIEGFVGGMCPEHSVRAYALQALARGESVLLRILPFDEEGETSPADQVAGDDAVVVQNPCLSGGVIEVFLEPVLPAPRVLVVGDTPTAEAVVRIGAELGSTPSTSVAATSSPAPATSHWWSRRMAATSCTRCAAAWRRVFRTSAWSRAPSAARVCSPSCAATASPTSNSP